MKSVVKGFRLKYVMIVTLFGRKMCFIAQNTPVHKVACFFSRNRHNRHALNNAHVFSV